MLKVIGGEQEGEFKAVASGTLPNGKPVVVNADGTVSVVAAGVGNDASSGTPVTFRADTIFGINTAAIFDSSANKVVIIYGGTSSYGYAIVGDVSGTSISFGSETLFESSISDSFSAAFDSNSNKVVIAYSDDGNSNKGTAVVGTVSGTSISFGTPVIFETGQTTETACTFDTNSNKVVINYVDLSNSYYGTAIVGTVSGTSISFGTPVVYESAETNNLGATFDSDSNKVVLTYYDDPASDGTAVVGTVSGTSISFGTPVVFSSTRTTTNSTTFDSNSNKVVIAYRDFDNSSKGAAIVGTVSGSSISFGTKVIFEDNNIEKPVITFDSSTSRVVIAYRDSGNSGYGTVITGEVSGTSLSFGTKNVYDSVDTDWGAITFDSNSAKAVVSYKQVSNSYGKSVVVTPTSESTNLTEENYIGMSRGFTDRGTQGFGDPVIFLADEAQQISSAFDSTSNKVVTVYQDVNNSGYGTAIVGTVSGSSISYGSPVVFNTANTTDTSVTFDSSSGKVVVTYRDHGNSNYGTAIVGTVSGNSISFGSEVVFASSYTEYTSATFDSNANKVLVSYRNASGPTGDAIVGTVSGTSISFGTSSVFNSGGTASYVSSAFDSLNNKVVIGFVDNGDSSHGKAIVATISGTSVSFGSKATFNAATTSDVAIVYDSSAAKVALFYQDGGNSSYGTGIVGTVSGTSISFGSEAVFESSTVYYTSAAYDSNANKIVVGVQSSRDSFSGTGNVGTISGTSISFGDPFTFETGVVYDLALLYDSTAKRVVFSYRDNTNSNYGTSVVFSNTYDSSGSVADTNPASLDIIGSVSTNQSGLTAGEKYYVQKDGTLSTTAGDPSVLAGTAIASNKLLVKT